MLEAPPKFHSPKCVEPSPQNHLPGAEVRRCIILVHHRANSTAPGHRVGGPWSWIWGRGSWWGFKGDRFCPFHSPLRIHSSLIMNQTWTFFQLGNSFMLGKRQHLISKPGRENFKRFKTQLQKFLGHQITFSKQGFDELRANESETYGLNSP